MKREILDFEEKKDEKENFFFKRSVLCLKISIFLSFCTIVFAWNNESYYVNDIYGIIGIISNVIAFIFSAYGFSTGVIGYIKKEPVLSYRGVVLVVNLILMIFQGLLAYANLT